MTAPVILKRPRVMIPVIGKPERLKYDWSDWLSRRINEEHRIVYKYEHNRIVVYSLRYHYHR